MGSSGGLSKVPCGIARDQKHGVNGHEERNKKASMLSTGMQTEINGDRFVMVNQKFHRENTVLRMITAFHSGSGNRRQSQAWTSNQYDEPK
jgi:hypothetical protein